MSRSEQARPREDQNALHRHGSDPVVTEGVAPVNGGQLYYERRGRGHPLVLIPPDLLDSRIWDLQISMLSESHEVIRYDPRGSGKSSNGVESYRHAEDLARLLDWLHVAQAYCLGFGTGANIALEFALEDADRVDGLVLAGASLHGYRPPGVSREVIERLDYLLPQFAALRDQERDTPDFAERFIALLVGMSLSQSEFAPSESALQSVRAVALENLRRILPLSPAVVRRQRWLEPPAIARLSQIQAPTLIVVGQRMLPDAQLLADKLQADIPGARKVMVPDASELMHLDQPEDFNRIVLDFLDSLPQEEAQP